MSGAAAEIRIAGPASLRGEIAVPGDKSISHRAVILGALAEGETLVSNLSPGEDNARTIEAFRAMGVRITPRGPEIAIAGAGVHGLAEPAGPIDCGNSGTSMRLLAGVAAGQPFTTTLTGDRYLLRRPMRRIVDPLMAMGARIGGDRGEGEEIRAPLVITGPPGGAPLHPIEIELTVASAQVKSAVLLAGLYARGRTAVIEPGPARDHTERMLRAFGAEVSREGDRIAVTGGPRLRGMRIDIPGDLSAAAFFLVAALITPGSELRVRGVGVNPTRTGALDILRAMGADLAVVNAGERGGEPVADLVARSSRLRATEVRGSLVVRAIDEFPILAVAAACAEGTTRIRDAAELRTKETDRIEAMVTELGKLGVRARAVPDGMDIEGGATLTGARCSSHGDHRVAMALAVAGLRARGETVIEGADMVATSFPGFREALDKVIVAA